MLAVAESCTGGAVMAKIVESKGASDWFAGGVVAYSREEKERLGVSADGLEAHGTMSAYASEQLAHKIRDRFGASKGLAVTGNADEGEAWIALAGDGELDVRHIRTEGTRLENIEVFRDAAISMLQLP